MSTLSAQALNNILLPRFKPIWDRVRHRFVMQIVDRVLYLLILIAADAQIKYPLEWLLSRSNVCCVIKVHLIPVQLLNGDLSKKYHKIQPFAHMHASISLIRCATFVRYIYIELAVQKLRQSNKF